MNEFSQTYMFHWPLRSEEKNSVTPPRADVPYQTSLEENLSRQTSVHPSGVSHDLGVPKHMRGVKVPLKKSLVLSSDSTVQLPPSKPIVLWTFSVIQLEGLSVTCRDEIENF